MSPGNAITARDWCQRLSCQAGAASSCLGTPGWEWHPPGAWAACAELFSPEGPLGFTSEPRAEQQGSPAEPCSKVGAAEGPPSTACPCSCIFRRCHHRQGLCHPGTRLPCHCATVPPCLCATLPPGCHATLPLCHPTSVPPCLCATLLPPPAPLLPAARGSHS